jgi:lysophospholipase L1-like esterase
LTGVGLLALQVSSAATAVVAREAEAGTRAGNVSLVSVSGASGQSSVKFGSTGTQPAIWKIMPLGDSITTGDPYRQQLYDLLVAAGKRIDLVGSQHSSDSSMSDPDHEGHSGWQNNQMSQNAQQFVAATMPDIVVVHMGTNDIWSNIEPSVALSRLRDVVDAIYAGNPQTRIVLSKIILMNVGVDAQWQAYDAGVPQIVSDYRARGKSIYLADLSATLTANDLGDGVHPTADGYRKMGSAYAPIVLQAMAGN